MTYEQSIILTGDKWSDLSEERKLEVLQTIENHSAFEAGRLSCPVVGKFLYTGTDGIVLGSYDPEKQVIYVNCSQLASDSKYGKDSETMVTTCLHEGRHAYQHQVVKGIITHNNQMEADMWKKNLKDDNYISFEDNPKAYYNQPVEVDARRFAEEKYAEIVAVRKSNNIEQLSEYDPKGVFERQLFDKNENVTRPAAAFQQEEKESNRISIN